MLRTGSNPMAGFFYWAKPQDFHSLTEVRGQLTGHPKPNLTCWHDGDVIKSSHDSRWANSTTQLFTLFTGILGTGGLAQIFYKILQKANCTMLLLQLSREKRQVLKIHKLNCRKSCLNCRKSINSLKIKWQNRQIHFLKRCCFYAQEHNKELFLIFWKLLINKCVLGPKKLG